jgi:flagellar protein FliO/FliZ
MSNHAHVHGPSMMMMGVRLFASFFVVLLLFVGAVALVRYLQRRAPSLRRENRDSIEILTSCSLAPKTTLSVVSVKGEQFLIGVTPNSVNLLSRLGGGEGGADLSSAPIPSEKRSPSERTDPIDFSKSDQKGFDHLLKETVGRLKDVRETRETPSNGRRWSV